MAHVEDIITSLLFLDSQGIEFNFAARNLKRLPRWEPNETDYLSIAEKLVLLDGRLKSLEYVVSENKVEISETRDKISRIDKRVEQNEHCIIGGIENKTSGTPQYSDVAQRGPVQKSVSEKPRVPPLVPLKRPNVRHHNGITFIGKPVTREIRQKKQPSGETLRESDDESRSQDDPDERPFIKPKEQIRRDRRRRQTIIRGKATTDRFRTAPPPVRDFFLYRIDKLVSEDDIKDHLKQESIQCSAVSKMSNEYAKFSSFKVTVPITEVSKVMNGDTWPEGAMIRKFTVRNNNPDNNDA